MGAKNLIKRYGELYEVHRGTTTKDEMGYIVVHDYSKVLDEQLLPKKPSQAWQSKKQDGILMKQKNYLFIASKDTQIEKRDSLRRGTLKYTVVDVDRLKEYVIITADGGD